MGNQYIVELTEEAHEIFTNINMAAENGDITWGQREELVRILCNDVADAANLQELARILCNDVADAANLQKVRELLYAWQ